MALEGYKQYDIRNYSFDQFVDFLFNHEVPDKKEESAESDPWYYKSEVQCSPEKVVEYYTRLFSDPSFLFDRFSLEQMEQGFWVIPGQNIDCAAGEVIWDHGTEFEKRAECVRKMYHVYEKVYTVDFLVTSGEMWWDALCYDWHCNNRNRSNGGEDLLMQDVMFETLKRILGLSSLDCQVAALHGIGHLHHPDTVKTVEQFLEKHTNLDSWMIEYANAASRFEVL